MKKFLMLIGLAVMTMAATTFQKAIQDLYPVGSTVVFVKDCKDIKAGSTGLVQSYAGPTIEGEFNGDDRLVISFDDDSVIGIDFHQSFVYVKVKK